MPGLETASTKMINSETGPAQLLQIPLELLAHIASLVEASDYMSFKLVCKALASSVVTPKPLADVMVEDMM